MPETQPLQNDNAPDQPQGTDNAFNIGFYFVAGFRWVLLLLFTLIMEKAMEGIAQRAGGGPTFAEPMTQLALCLNYSWIPYLCGAFQMVITLLFAIRYLLCALDPLERLAKIDTLSIGHLGPRSIRDALASIRAWHLWLVALVAIPEFVLLFHASLALPVLSQWLLFLFWLILWDSLVFFAILPSIQWISRFRILKLTLRHYLKKAQRAYRATVDGGGQASGEATEEKSYQKALDTQAAILLHLRRAKGEYGWWNTFDLLLVFIGLVFSVGLELPDRFGTGSEAALLVVMLITTVWLTRKNYRKQPTLWQRHMVVLRCAR